MIRLLSRPVLVVTLLVAFGFCGPARPQGGLPDWLSQSDALLEPAPDADPETAARAQAEVMAQEMEAQVEDMFGASSEEVKEMSGLEIMLRLGANALSSREQLQSSETSEPSPIVPHQLLALPGLTSAPPAGFADNALPLPAERSGAAVLTVSEPPGPAILVVTDPVERRVLLREDVSLPLRRELSLRPLSHRVDTLVIELIDPASRRILQRFRLVAEIPQSD